MWYCQSLRCGLLQPEPPAKTLKDGWLICSHWSLQCYCHWRSAVVRNWLHSAVNGAVDRVSSQTSGYSWGLHCQMVCSHGFTPSSNHIRSVNNLSLSHETSWRLSSWALQYLQCHTTKHWLVALSLSTGGLTAIQRGKGSCHGCDARRGIGISLTYRLALML